MSLLHYRPKPRRSVMVHGRACTTEAEVIAAHEAANRQATVEKAFELRGPDGPVWVCVMSNGLLDTMDTDPFAGRTSS